MKIVETKHGFCQWVVDFEMIEEDTGYETEMAEKEYARIDCLKVDKDHRGQGIGRKLLEMAVADIKAAHPDLPIKIVAQPLEDDIDMDMLYDFYKTIDGIDEVVVGQ